MIFTDFPVRIKYGEFTTTRPVDGFIVLYGAPAKGEVTAYLMNGRKRVTPIMGTELQPVLDENGDPVLTQPTPVFTEVEVPVTTEVQNPVLDTDGNPVLDENGNPTYTTEFVPVLDSDGNPVTNIEQVPVLDADGNQVFEGGGEPVTQEVTVQVGEHVTLLPAGTFMAATKKLLEKDFVEKNVLEELHQIFVAELAEDNPDVSFEVKY